MLCGRKFNLLIINKHFAFSSFIRKLKMEKSIVSKILIVGCGLTGSVTANLIRHEVMADVTIWEKEKNIGGRFYTYLNPSEPTRSSVDLGAQYVSATLDFIRSHARFYDELIDKDKLVPLEGKIENFRKLSESKTNFVAPKGTQSLVHHFLKNADAKLYMEYEVSEINLKADSKQWEVKTSSGDVNTFDAVILTMPVPEVLKLSGTFHDNISQTDDIKMAMEQVKFSSRFALGVLYDDPVQVLDNLPWFAKFFPDDDMICFVSVDNRKRGNLKDLPSVLIHATLGFSQTHWNKPEEEVQKLLLDHLKCLIPELPEPSHTKCIKWTYSQVTDAYIDNPGCVILNEHPSLICGGDSFTESDFNGCITSAIRIVEELLKLVPVSRPNKVHYKKPGHKTIS